MIASRSAWWVDMLELAVVSVSTAACLIILADHHESGSKDEFR